MNKTILICTVGGSHQPIVTACRELEPSFICFVCSGKDPGTGRAGSESQIIGKGLCIKALYNDSSPTLPNIPAQLNLPADAFQVLIVPTDDLDGAVLLIREEFVKLGRRFPGARIVADYTGGTKTMTAALVTAVLETEDVDLQLVTGNRADLVKVHNGTEYSALAGIDAIRLQRAMAPYLQAWQRFAYDEAAEGLAALRPPRSPELRSRLSRARDLSRAFAAWDRFEHQGAIQIMENYAPVISRDLGMHLVDLKMLTTASPSQEPIRLFDLWRNAERRAAQGRYDDAVARVYRLIEWSAQWILKNHFNIDTADIPAERIPSGLHIQTNQEGRNQAGLFAAWGLIEQLADKTGAAGSFAACQRPAMLDHLKARNSSILAHGFTPIGKEIWENFQTWIENIFLPMLLAEVASEKGLRIRRMSPQLPSTYLW